MKSPQQIIQEIKAGQLAPIYLLDGEEPFYIDQILKTLEGLVPEEEKDFNLITLYGQETNWQEVTNAARQFPMFGERILVILREASKMRDLGELSGYVKNPQTGNILVIEHRFKKVDGRNKLPKLVEKAGVYFTSNKVKEDEIPNWIIQFCNLHQSKISLNDAQTLTAYLGQDLQKIANELNKIWINKDEGHDITPEKIEKYIGVNREFNVLELPVTIFENNGTRLANMLNYFMANPNSAPLPALIGVFFAFLQKVYLAQQVPQNFTKDRQLGIWTQHRNIAKRYSPFQIHRAVSVLEEFSCKAVGINTLGQGYLLGEMTGKLQVIFRS